MHVYQVEQQRQFWRKAKVCEMTGLAPSTVDLYASKRIRDFPRSIKLGSGAKNARGVVWVAGEVMAWIEKQIQQRDSVAA
jgi:predicted DNA-binding transcriptional regulator AlpA